MSVISTLRDRATTTPSDEAFVFMDYDTKTGDQIDRMTWSQLYSRVTAVSAYLISYGRHADRRRTAAISAPQGLDYVAGFLGALCAGWTPVPLPEPLGSLRDKRTGLAVLDCAADVVLTTSQAETRVRATIATHGASVTTPVIALDTLTSHPEITVISILNYQTGVRICSILRVQRPTPWCGFIHA